MTTTNIEAQAQYIRDKIITPDQRRQAHADVLSVSEAAWNSAFLSLELQDKIVPELSITAIRMAVAGEYHCKDSTVRRREHVAQLFWGENAYRAGVISAHPDITFDYWKVARQARHLDDAFESMLDIICQIEYEKDRRGKLPLLAEVISWVDPNKEDYVTSVHLARLDGVLSQFDKIKADGYAPRELRDLIGYCQVLLQTYRDTGKSPLIKEKAPG